MDPALHARSSSHQKCGRKCSVNTRLIRVLVASLTLMWIGFAGARGKDVTLTYLEGQVVTTIDPAKYTDESSHHAIINMYDPLL
jgi:hypothetical protein